MRWKRVMQSVALSGLVLLTACMSMRVSESEVDAYFEHVNDEIVDQDPELVCSVHLFPTVLCEVPVLDGMCLTPHRSYIRSTFREFPNSFWDVSSCTCVSFGERYVFRHVCPLCRRAERTWRVSHGWRVDSEVPCPPGSG